MCYANAHPVPYFFKKKKISITCFSLIFQAIQTTMHQGAADNITHLEAKTQYGRPAWNRIFKDIADKHKGCVVLYRY